MKHLAFFFLLITSLASAQTVGQYEIRKRGASGFTSYGVTLNNGQVIGQTAGVPAAITPFDGAFSSLSGIPANSSGVLTNNGSGTLTYAGTSTGGNGAGDNAKLVKFGTGGSITGSQINVSDGVSNTELGLSSLRWTSVLGGGFSTTLDWTIPTANRTITLPDATGTVITTGNLSSITQTGTITSGTWQGSIIAPAYLGTGTSISTKYLRGDGTWQTVSGGVADADYGHITVSGSGGTWTIDNGVVSNAKLANSSITINGSAISLGGSVTTATLGANTFTAVQTASFGITAATQGDGLVLANSTAATNGNQTWSPSLKLSGNQWTGSASRVVSGVLTFVPVQQAYDHAIFRLSTKHGTDALTTLLDIRNFNGAPVIERGGLITIGSSGANGALLMQYNGTVYAGLMATSGAGSFVVATDTLTIGSGGYYGGLNDMHLNRENAAILQLGADTNADATDQTFKSADGSSGTDRSGADLTLASGRGTGAGAASALIFSTPSALSTGTTAQTLSERVRISSAGITIGSGSAISKVLTATASLDFGSIAAQSSADLTVTVTGAATGDAVVMGLPASPSAGVVFNAFVSSSNTVTIRATNATSGAIDPASATFRATVIQH